MTLKRVLTVAGTWSLRVLGGGALAFVIFLAFRWAETTQQFDLVDVRVMGNRFLDKGDLSQWVQLPADPALMDIDLEYVQTHLESHPYIKAARVSRDFPGSLRIDVVERVPLAYINQSPFHLIDQEGVILPASDQAYEFDIPTLSGFNPAQELYPVGEQCLSQKVLEAVDYLNLIRNRFPRLYADLSEVRINAGDEYVLYLSHYPTEILLGAAHLSQRLSLLQQFAQTVRGIRSLHDYRYVDLRYKKQIVVRERG
ncbi:MAG: cell division protein FtsQ/DivIB [Fidelibacterota bacterium]